jgi:hypothetical protein
MPDLGTVPLDFEKKAGFRPAFPRTRFQNYVNFGTD